jgi:hypothetical protein
MVARALVDCERTGIRRNAEFAGVAAGAVGGKTATEAAAKLLGHTHFKTSST